MERLDDSRWNWTREFLRERGRDFVREMSLKVLGGMRGKLHTAGECVLCGHSSTRVQGPLQAAGLMFTIVSRQDVW